VNWKILKRAPLLFSAVTTLIAFGLEFFSTHSESLAWVNRLKSITYDWRVRFCRDTSAPAPSQIGYVLITDDSIKTVAQGALGYGYGLYWPRAVYGELIAQLKLENARLIGMDVLFDQLRPDHKDFRLDPLDENVQVVSDYYFADNIAEAGNVALASEKSSIPAALFRTNAMSLGDISSVKDSDGVIRRDRPFQLTRIWHQKLQELFPQSVLDNARINKTEIVFVTPHGTQGNDVDLETTIPLASNGEFTFTDVDPFTGEEKSQSVIPYKDVRVWNMGLLLGAKYLGLNLDEAKIFKDRIEIHGTGTSRTIPLDREGYFLVDWRYSFNDTNVMFAGSHDTILAEPIEALLWRHKLHKATQISNSMAIGAAETFKWTNLSAKISGGWSNRIAMVGSVASGNDLTDRGATPLDRETFLTSKFLNVIASLLDNRFITPLPMGWSLVLILGFGVVAALCSSQTNILISFVSIIAASGAYFILATFVFKQYLLSLPVFVPVVVVLWGTYILISSYRVFFEQAEKRRVQAYFERLVSPNIVKELLGKETLSLGGVRRKITIYFADIRGFTELTDTRHAKVKAYVISKNLNAEEAEKFFDSEAAETLETVNLYLATISDIVKKHNGTLDKYIGDCVMAFWGAPASSSSGTHAVDAVRAAVEAQRAIFKINQDRFRANEKRKEANLVRESKGQPPLEMFPLLSLGTGINTGEAVVGMMGSDAHIANFTAFGREVNLASRLESASGRGRILIGEGTYLELAEKDAELESLCKELSPLMVKGFSSAVKVYEVFWNMPKPATEAKGEIPSSGQALN
jgi:class 3 adenylate cyclase/CHASE2 domain-containing sensor protein